MCLSASTQKMAEKTLRSIGRGDLVDDPRFRTNAERLRHADALDQLVGGFIALRTMAETLAHFDQAGVTIGPIMDAASLQTDEFVAQREALIEVPDADVGWLPMHGHVPRLSGTPGVLVRPAPRLGEHSSAVLSALLGDAAVQQLRESAVICGE